MFLFYTQFVDSPLGPSINYVRIFSRILDPPTPPVALSMHLNDPPPLLRTYIQESETPPRYGTIYSTTIIYISHESSYSSPSLNVR